MIRPAWLLAGPVFLSACTVGPEPEAPDLNSAASFENAIAIPERAIREDWYLAFEDPVLTELVETALANNLDISAARATLDVSRANARAARTTLLPSLDAFINGQLGGALAGDIDANSTLSGGLSMAFDPDIAGRNDRALEAARARVDAAAFSVLDVRRLVVQAVVLEYISLRRAGSRLTLLDETLDLQARTLEIVQARFDVGLSPALDVDRAAADLARSRAQRGQFEADRKRAAYALSVLTGLAPSSSAFDADYDAIPLLVGNPELGVPSDLLRNRPDVRRAEA
ncbi:MAG: TolC family protein, partial [Pseudomonadota bacterium]